MAYNIAQNQVLAQPVSAFEKGRALNFADAQAAREMRLADQQIQLNDMAIEGAGKPDPKEQRAADEARRKRAAELLTFGRDAATRSLSMYQQAIEGGKSEEEARALAQEQQRQDIQFATNVWGEDLANQLDPDGVFSPEEAEAAITQTSDLLGKANLSTGQFREGNDFVTRVIQDGMPDMTDAGVLARSPIRESTPSTTVNLDTGPKIPESILKVGIEASSKADTLTNQVNELAVFRELAADAETGALTPITLPIKQAFQDIGISVGDDVPLLEALQAQQNQMALRLRNPESGFGLTGNTSNQDIRFLKDAVAGIGKTPEGNQAVLTIMLAKQRREAELSQLKANFIFEQGTLTGWDKVRDKFIKETPFFTPDEQELLTGLKAGGDDASMPDGFDPKLWKAMTPEERKLWAN